LDLYENFIRDVSLDGEVKEHIQFLTSFDLVEVCALQNITQAILRILQACLSITGILPTNSTDRCTCDLDPDQMTLT